MRELGRLPSTDSSLASVIGSLVSAYKEGWEQHERSSRDETSTPGARLVKSVKAARSKLPPLVERLDASAATLSSAAALEVKVTAAFNPPDKKYETVIRHAEIRQMFRSMPRGDAMKGFAEAREQGDEDTLIALASYQHYLTGLPKQVHEQARQHLIEVHAPKEAAAVASLKEQVNFAAQFRAEVLGSTSSMLDFAKADEIIAAAREDAGT